MNPDYQVMRITAETYKWAYEYLQERMRSLGRESWAQDCDGEIQARIEMAKATYFKSSEAS